MEEEAPLSSLFQAFSKSGRSIENTTRKDKKAQREEVLSRALIRRAVKRAGPSKKV